jgi:hypothetical protein
VLPNAIFNNRIGIPRSVSCPPLRFVRRTGSGVKNPFGYNLYKGKIIMSRSVRIIGWSTALFSIAIILSEVPNLLTNPMDQFKMVFNMFPQAKKGMDGMTDLFQYSRLWSIYMILYFLYVFVGSIQFIRFQAIGRMILEIACWVGIVNGCIDSFLSFILWKQMQAALSNVTGTMGIGLGNLNPLGMATIILGFFLWIIPTIGMIVYLRKPGLKALME